MSLFSLVYRHAGTVYLIQDQSIRNRQSYAHGRARRGQKDPEEVRFVNIFLALVSRESCNPVAHLLKDDYCNML